MSGDGPMVGMMARVGNVDMTSSVQTVEVVQLSDDMFAPPAGNKLNVKK